MNQVIADTTRALTNACQDHTNGCFGREQGCVSRYRAALELRSRIHRFREEAAGKLEGELEDREERLRLPHVVRQLDGPLTASVE